MNSYFSHLLLLIKRIGILFFIFSICRVLFYALNYEHFNAVSLSLFFYGLRFDLVSITYLYLPLIFLHIIPFPFRSKKWYDLVLTITFYLLTLIVTAVNIIDVAYFDFTLKRTTSDFFSMVSTGSDFFTLLPHYIIDFWYNYILFFILLFIAWFLNKKLNTKKPIYKAYTFKSYIIHTLIFVLFSTSN